MAKVFVVGNVSAIAAVPELESVEWGAVTKDSVATETPTDDSVSTTKTSRTNSIVYKDVKAELDTHEYGKVTTKVKQPKSFTLKDEGSLANVAVRYSVDGKDKGTATATFGTHKVTISRPADIDLIADVTVDDTKSAISGDGYITKTFTIVYDVYDTDANGYNADLKENKAKPIISITEEVIVKIEASSLTLKNEDSEEVWNAKIASDYKATLVSATETEENKTTEENKKDDVPKTGEVIYSS